MKFLPVRDFVTVTNALNFDTPDCHVTGACDLYTTKATGTDKKLYKNIDQNLESQHAALLKFGASLSPPMREEMAASLNLSRSSPFGSLADISSRRTFAYLIATLNASHSDYEFSSLRPADFKREKDIRRVMTSIDSTLGNVGTTSGSLDLRSVGPGVGPNGNGAGAGGPGASSYGSSAADFESAGLSWGPRMWAMIDQEMTLSGCSVFSYQPAENPFEEEKNAIWTLHYFFFNKTLKRVAYLYARGVPVTSHNPCLDLPLGVGRGRRGRLLGGGGGSSGASKRARFWLGDRAADRVRTESDDDMDDGLVWNRNADGEFDAYPYDDDTYFYDDDYDVRYDEDDEDDDDEDMDDVDDDEDDDNSRSTKEHKSKGRVRAVSEDIASRMEIE